MSPQQNELQPQQRLICSRGKSAWPLPKTASRWLAAGERDRNQVGSHWPDALLNRELGVSNHADLRFPRMAVTCLFGFSPLGRLLLQRYRSAVALMAARHGARTQWPQVRQIACPSQHKRRKLLHALVGHACTWTGDTNHAKRWAALPWSYRRCNGGNAELSLVDC